MSYLDLTDRLQQIHLLHVWVKSASRHGTVQAAERESVCV